MPDFDVQHRDCFDSLEAMREAGGCDLILTSPPYPDARKPEAYGAEFDTSLAGYGRLGDAVFEALKPGGVCALNPKTRAKHDTGRGSYVQGATRCATTALFCSCNPATVDQEHEAPFSRDLADAYVLCYSPPGGLVGDPFVGSGTVAYSCHRHGRRFIGGDLGTRKETSVNGRKVKCGRRWADIVNDGLRQGRLFA